MESQIMINIIDVPWRWRVAAHRTCTQEEVTGGGGRAVAPPGVRDYGARSLHLRPFHVSVVHLRTICLLESPLRCRRLRAKYHVRPSLHWRHSNPRPGRGGGQILPSPHVFRRYPKNLQLDSYELFST